MIDQLAKKHAYYNDDHKIKWFDTENFLDESHPSWYTRLTEGERIMFNPLEILDNKFTVVFTKQDGTLREMTGVLFEKDKFASDYGPEYCASLVDKDLIVMLTEQGWRSFNKSKVISVVIHND